MKNSNTWLLTITMSLVFLASGIQGQEEEKNNRKIPIAEVGNPLDFVWSANYSQERLTVKPEWADTSYQYTIIDYNEDKQSFWFGEKSMNIGEYMKTPTISIKGLFEIEYSNETFDIDKINWMENSDYISKDDFFHSIEGTDRVRLSAMDPTYEESNLLRPYNKSVNNTKYTIGIEFGVSPTAGRAFHLNAGFKLNMFKLSRFSLAAENDLIGNSAILATDRSKWSKGYEKIVVTPSLSLSASVDLLGAVSQLGVCFDKNRKTQKGSQIGVLNGDSRANFLLEKVIVLGIGYEADLRDISLGMNGGYLKFRGTINPIAFNVRNVLVTCGLYVETTTILNKNFISLLQIGVSFETCIGRRMTKKLPLA